MLRWALHLLAPKALTFQVCRSLSHFQLRGPRRGDFFHADLRNANLSNETPEWRDYNFPALECAVDLRGADLSNRTLASLESSISVRNNKDWRSYRFYCPLLAHAQIDPTTKLSSFGLVLSMDRSIPEHGEGPGARRDLMDDLFQFNSTALFRRGSSSDVLAVRKGWGQMVWGDLRCRN